MTAANKSTPLTLPSDREIRMSRIFDAPRDLVFKTMTDPTAVPHWWGPRSLTTVVETMDVRPGGSWRFVQNDANGGTYVFHGEYREVTPPERVVNTFEFDGFPGHVVVEMLTLEDLGARTRVTMTSFFESTEDRDGMLHSGMETGAVESWDRLEELFARQA